MNMRSDKDRFNLLALSFMLVISVVCLSFAALAQQVPESVAAVENGGNDFDWKLIAFIVAGFIAVAESAIIVVLALNIYKRKHQELLLAEEKATLAKKIEGRDKEIQHANRELQKEIQARQQYEEEHKHLSVADTLTGALNRNVFLEKGEQEFSRSKRYQRELSVLVLDMDDFKQINQKFGYKVGDEALKALSDTCLNALRETDIFGRIGDEEFAAVLPETDMKLAAEVAERLRLSLSMIAVGNGKKRSRCTVSIGVTTMSDKDKKLELLVNKADAALQTAKKSGKNKVVVG